MNSLLIRITQQLQGATGPMTITELSERLDVSYSQIAEAVGVLVDQKVVEVRQIGSRGKLVSLRTENPTLFFEPLELLDISIQIIRQPDELSYAIRILSPLAFWESEIIQGSGNRDHVRGTIRALVRVLVDRFLDGRKE